MIISDLQNKVYNLSEKIERLLDVYLAQDIDRETYLKERSKLFYERKTMQEKIQKLETDATVWLEPMREWVESVSTLDEIAKRNDLPSRKSSDRTSPCTTKKPKKILLFLIRRSALRSKISLILTQVLLGLRRQDISTTVACTFLIL